MNKENSNVITYEKTVKKLKDVKLEDMTKQDVFDRYIAYGSYEELKTPEIQKLLIKHGYGKELIDMVTIITDEKVIKMLYECKIFENYNRSGIKLCHGKLSKIKIKKDKDEFNISYEFIQFNNTRHYFNGNLAYNQKEIEQIKTEIEPYKDHLIAVYDFDTQRDYSKRYHLKCFLKEIIDVEDYLSECQYIYENARKTIKDICNKKLEENYGKSIPEEIQVRVEEELKKIYENNYENLYILNYLITKKAKEDNEYYVLRGAGTNSYIAYLLGISYLNPLEYGLKYEISYGIKGERPLEFYYYFSFRYYFKILKYITEESKKNICFDTNYIDSKLIQYVLHIHIGLDLGIDALYELKEETGMDYNNIDIKDEQIWKIFEEYNKLVDYIPSFIHQKTIEKQKTKSIEELTVIYGLSVGNFEIEDDKDCKEKLLGMKDFSTRDDVYLFLLNKNIEKEKAFEIVEFISKGKANNKRLHEEWKIYQDIMKKHNISSEYISKCEKVKYIFPKSNILNNALHMLKYIAYKVYYPEITEKIIGKYPRLL